MSHFAETMLLGDCFGPLLNGRTLNFNGTAARATDQMVMMAISTEAVNRLTVFTTKEIHHLVIE
jgi:hypothetical protein